MNRLSWGRVLRRWWQTSLGLSLSLAATSASAGEIEWHAVSNAPSATPAVTMLAPVPLPDSRPGQPSEPGPLRAVSFSGGNDADTRVIFRAQMSDPPKAMPVGLPDGPNDPPAKKPFDGAPMPHVLPAPTSLWGSCEPGPGPSCAGGNPDGCGAFCANDCCGVPSNAFWVSAEALVWWVKGQALPPLVTVGSPTDALPGALGQPGTAVVFGGDNVGNAARGGGRMRAGWWFDEEHTLGIDGGFFVLGQQLTSFAGSSPGNPAVFRPFFNPGFAFDPATGTFVRIAPTPDAEAVAFPGALGGNISVRLTSQLWGYDANLRTHLWNGCCGPWAWTVDGYTGFRALGLDEKLDINERLISLIPGTPGSITVEDRFGTHNRFYGWQVGFDTELRYGNWFVDLGTKVALGDVHQTVNIFGQTQVTDVFGGVITSPGGLLAQSSNIGRHTRDRLAVLPEGTFNVGYQVTNWFRVYAGYNILYLSNVARPAAQINTVVNPTLIPLNGTSFVGPAQPSFTFRSTDFFAQGLNLGLEFRW
jgi:hypothetical protein